MSLNSTPSSERIHIGFFGRTNAGKSSLINAITEQEISLVSAVKGTTTDPVKKAMELLPLGAVVWIDTPGLEDHSPLGSLREKKTEEILDQIHVGILVADAREGMTEAEYRLQKKFDEKQIPYFVVYNKADLLAAEEKTKEGLYVSARTGENIQELKNRLASLNLKREEKKLVSDLLLPGEHILLVIPIDKAAPKGRLILPQQQTIRDILDAGCTLSICQPQTLTDTWKLLQKPPKLVITDSQVFKEVKDLLPEDVLLTSFSILFARYKGTLERTIQGAYQLNNLQDGDKILISEGCTHHRQCGDIGTQKLPKWILEYTGKKLVFEFTSGGSFPEDLSSYQLVIHCGACMLNEKQMQARAALAETYQVPMSNYGIVIAYLNGILERSIKPFSFTSEGYYG